MKRHVIVGNGGAAISAVEALRSTGSADQITLISGERSPACCPVLTTYFLSGVIPYDAMFYRDWGFYQRNDVRLVLGRPAAQLDVGAARVELDNGAVVNYDDLLIATGSTTPIPPIPGIAPERVLTLWSAEDALAIEEASRRAATVAILGAGFIGLQVADAMHKKGKRTVVVEMADRVLPQVMDHQGAAILHERMLSTGVDLRLGEQVVRIQQEGTDLALCLSSGTNVKADLVIVATGVKPNIGWLERSGLHTALGLMVDEQGRTNVENVYAAGDVAESYDAVTQRSRVNATWTNAVEQGRAVGLTMVGKTVPRLAGTQVNVFTLFGVPCASAGVSGADPGGCEVRVERGPAYRKLLFRQGVLVGALLVGEVDEIGILASVIRRQPALYAQQCLEQSGFSALARLFSQPCGGW